MNGKGDKPRDPARRTVTADEYARNWERTFGKKKNKAGKPCRTPSTSS